MKKYRIEIRHDDDPINPRESDNCCHMSFSHKHYDLGDKEYKIYTEELCGWDEVRHWLEKEKGAYIIVQVSMTDHSGISIYAGDPKDAWDSGIIGFAWMTYDEMVKNIGPDCQETIDKAREIINAEIEEYDKYLNGDYYIAFIYDENDDIVESCGNFSDRDRAKEWAESYCCCLQKQNMEENNK